MEEQLHRIANRKSDVFTKLDLPKQFGKHSNITCAETLKLVPIFDPTKKDHKFAKTWNALVLTGEDPNGLDLSETGYRVALMLTVKGEAIDYITT